MKSRPYYQYMLDLIDKKVSYYSTDDISQIVYDLLDDGDAAAAMTACQRGLDQHPHDESLEMIEAKVLLCLKRYDEAEKLLTGNPDETSPFGIGIRFGIDFQTRDQRQAFEALLRQLKSGNITALEYVEIIDEYFDSLPHDLTAEYMQEGAVYVNSKGPKPDAQDAEALGRMGALLMDCSCHREAVPILERALDVDAYDVFSWQDLARCHFELRRFDECRNSCEMGLAIDPENPLFNFALGFIECEKGEFEAAIEHLEKSRAYAEGRLQHADVHLDRQEIEQQTSVTYELLGNAYHNTAQYDKAQECMEILVRRLPNFAEGHYRLALIDLDHGNRNSALERMNKAVEIDPTNVKYQALRVTILTDMHRFEESLQGLDILIKLSPKTKAYLLAKAELAFNLKRYAEADKAYRSLLKLHPKDEGTLTLVRNYFEAIGDEEALKKLK